MIMKQLLSFFTKKHELNVDVYLVDFTNKKEELSMNEKEKSSLNSNLSGRITKDSYYLEIAKTVATRSTCLRRNYGAIIVNADRIVSTGYNGAPRGDENCCDRGTCPRIEKQVAHNTGDYSDCCSVHAEQNAIIHGTFSDMQGATLYLAGFDHESGDLLDAMPCPICHRMIKNAGIARVVATDTNLGSIEFIFRP